MNSPTEPDIMGYNARILMIFNPLYNLQSVFPLRTENDLNSDAELER